MQQSKLIQAFRTMSVSEFERMEKLVHSPFFNTNKKVIALFLHLKTGILKKRSKMLEIRVIYKAVFPNEEFNSGKLRQLGSKLQSLFYELLHQLSFEDNSMDRCYRISEQLNSRNLINHSSSFVKKCSNFENSNVDEYYTKFRHHFSQMKLNILNRDVWREETNSAYAAIKQFFFLNVVKLRAKAYHPKLEFEHVWLNIIYNEIIENPESVEKNPLLNLYIKIYQLMPSPESNSSYFKDTQELLIKYQDRIHGQEYMQIAYYLFNYLAYVMSSDNKKIYENAIEIYKIGDNKGQLISKENFNIIEFSNMVTVALDIGELEWIRKLIKKNKPFMISQGKQNQVLLWEATTLFYQGRLVDALEKCKKISQNDIVSDFNVRGIRLTAYFSLREERVFYSLVDSYRIFIIRNKYELAPKSLKILKIQIKYLKSSFDLLIKKDILYKEDFHNSKQKLLSQINSETYFPNKYWLIDHLNQVI